MVSRVIGSYTVARLWWKTMATSLAESGGCWGCEDIQGRLLGKRWRCFTAVPTVTSGSSASFPTPSHVPTAGAGDSSPPFKSVGCISDVGKDNKPVDSSTASSVSQSNPELSSQGKRITSYGYADVEEDMKGSLVGHVFSSVAEKYDLMNDLMSFGIHRLWKDEFSNLVDTPMRISSSEQLEEFHILDVAGGTGDIAVRILQKAKQRFTSTDLRLPRITVCDINREMLAVGQRRAAVAGHSEISWIVGDGENLSFDDASVDIVTIAFGIRNFTHIDRGLSEAYRVLKPGGRFLCLEFSKVDTPLLSSVYDAYSFYVIPTIGRLVAGDRASYQYLVESIRRFPSQNEFSQMMWDAGFRHISYSNFTFGVVAVHCGFKI